MTVFGAYARYYDLLNSDKDYAGEARYLEDLICRHRHGATSILDLGCGTGIHARHLVEIGLQVTGVEFSAEMLDRAARRREGLSDELSEKLRFIEGDIRTVRLDERFDVVTALFHVISYQTANSDLAAAFATASHHLREGGIFIFDFWYGPAVLSEGPSVRERRIEDGETRVVRHAEPHLDVCSNLVRVDYRIRVTDKGGQTTDEIRESHEMRYLFEPEIEALCSGAGLELLETLEWGTRRVPDSGTWGVYCVARA
jgi:SAM-dependent methyltransferase